MQNKEICSVLIESKDPNVYWRWLKHKLLQEKSQTVSDTHAFEFLPPTAKGVQRRGRQQRRHAQDNEE